MDTFCSNQGDAVGRELREQQQKVKHAVTAAQEHLSQDQTVLDQQRAQLLEELEQNQQLVHSFLLEELQQDVPTGMKVLLRLQLWSLDLQHSALAMPPGNTPRRQERLYPRELGKPLSRWELLETLQKQQLQEELQAPFQEEQEEAEDKRNQVDLVCYPVFLWPFRCSSKMMPCSPLARVGLSRG